MLRMGGRVVKCTSLENWQGGNSFVGSNPTLSAKVFSAVFPAVRCYLNRYLVRHTGVSRTSLRRPEWRLLLLQVERLNQLGLLVKINPQPPGQSVPRGATASARAITSTPCPAWNGTITVTALDGKTSCAIACAVAAP